MTDRVDPRIQERRRQVQATRARGSTKRLLWIMFVVAVAASLAWIVRSPALAITDITIDGVHQTPIDQLLMAGGIGLGDPLLLAPVGSAQEALLVDPWVLDAAVRKVLPNTIEVVVVERTAVAILEHRTSTVYLAADGTILAAAADVDLPEKGTILATSPPPVIGASITDPFDLAALEFIGAWAGPAVIVGRADGELWAQVDGFQVRLGGLRDMDEKARSLVAVLGQGQPPGSVINVMAPARPTVTPPADSTPTTTQP